MQSSQEESSVTSFKVECLLFGYMKPYEILLADNELLDFIPFDVKLLLLLFFYCKHDWITWMCVMCSFNNVPTASRCVACHTHSMMFPQTLNKTSTSHYNNNISKTHLDSVNWMNILSYIACYNDDIGSIISTLMTLANKLSSNNKEYYVLNTTLKGRLTEFEGVLDFLTFLGLELDESGSKMIYKTKPPVKSIANAISALTYYQTRFASKKNLLMENEEKMTLEQIIIRATHENIPTFQHWNDMNVLIIYHNQFIDSMHFLKRLKQRFWIPIPNDIRNDENKINSFRNNTQKRIHLKVFKGIRDWLKKYWMEDWMHNDELKNELSVWLNELSQWNYTHASSEYKWLKPISDRILKEFKRLKIKPPNDHGYRYAYNEDLLRLTSHVYFARDSLETIMDETACRFLADQLTFFDYRIFCKIKKRELLGESWQKKDSKLRSPNVLAMIKQFNNVILFTQMLILKQKSLRKRSQAIKYTIKMSERLYEIKNFNSLCAILCALNSLPIQQLKLAWKCVPYKWLMKLDELNNIFDRDFNSKNFRKIFWNISPPTIPYFGLFLQDLMFIENDDDELKKTYTCTKQPTTVNFNKCVRIMDIINNIISYQQYIYHNITSCMHTQKFLLCEFDKLKEITTEQIWSMSVEIKKQDEKDIEL
eukprot:414148_1